ncbi:twin-arginine translocation signal domain-containing protein [Polynucleobacter necessarius]|uniref:twin-arginine translocation signal domain-containing protein n=1 Tax=Polynucleobacter necessarius TaxID=576610 RepID=UPI001E39B17D|nr:twin-arginine translocation signal domain-containing protein [Polynucleobacter necessarius]
MSKEIQNSRRNFMKTSAISATAIGVGFVAASEPVIAAATETHFKGLKAGE